MELIERIQKATGLTDLTSAQLTLDLCYNREVMEKKAVAIADISDSAMAYFHYHGRYLEVVCSPSLKKHFLKLVPGTKVRYDTKTEEGKIAENMTRHGVIAHGAKVFYLNGIPCIRVDFGKGDEIYDAIGLIVEE